VVLKSTKSTGALMGRSAWSGGEASAGALHMSAGALRKSTGTLNTSTGALRVEWGALEEGAVLRTQQYEKSTLTSRGQLSANGRLWWVNVLRRCCG